MGFMDWYGRWSRGRKRHDVPEAGRSSIDSQRGAARVAHVPGGRHRKHRASTRHAGRELAGFGAVLRVREFRVLWFADMQSSIGDQLARVALSVLVYSDTRSGFLTAGVYALTFLPSLFGSLFLGTLADRIPRRALLVSGDVIRAGLLALMAWPKVPLPLLTALLVVAVIVGTPWKASESALVSEILAGEHYVLGTGLRVAAGQGAQLVGFGVGGLVVTAIGSHSALLVDAATFALSATMIGIGVRGRPRAGEGRARPTWIDGARVALGTPYLRALLGLAWLGGLVVVPEGLAAPYAAAIGGGAGTVGLLLAANPAGLLVGTVLYTRGLPPASRGRLVGVLAILACVPSILLWSEPALPLAMGLLALSGLACAYQTQVMTEFVVRIPRARRGHAISIASAGMLVAQGVGLIAGGAIAQAWGVGPAISVCGIAGTVIGIVLAGRRSRAVGRDRARLATDSQTNTHSGYGPANHGSIGAAAEL